MLVNFKLLKMFTAKWLGLRFAVSVIAGSSWPWMTLIPGTVQVMSLPLHIFLVSAQSGKEIKGKGPLHEIITEHCVWGWNLAGMMNAIV